MRSFGQKVVLAYFAVGAILAIIYWVSGLYRIYIMFADSPLAPAMHLIFMAGVTVGIVTLGSLTRFLFWLPMFCLWLATRADQPFIEWLLGGYFINWNQL